MSIDNTFSSSSQPLSDIPAVENSESPSLTATERVIAMVDTNSHLQTGVKGYFTTEEKYTTIAELNGYTPDYNPANGQEVVDMAVEIWKERINERVHRLESSPNPDLQEYQARLEVLAQENPEQFQRFCDALIAIVHASTLERLTNAGAGFLVEVERNHYREVAHTSEELSNGVAFSPSGQLQLVLGAFAHDEGKYNWQTKSDGTFRPFESTDILAAVLSHELRAASTIMIEYPQLIARAVGKEGQAGGLPEEFWHHAGISQAEMQNLLPPSTFYEQLTGITASHGKEEWSEQKATFGTFKGLNPHTRRIDTPDLLKVQDAAAVEGVLLSYLVRAADNVTAVSADSSIKYSTTNFGQVDLTLQGHLDSYFYETCAGSFVVLATTLQDLQTLRERFPQEESKIAPAIDNLNKLIQREFGKAMALRLFFQDNPDKGQEISHSLRQELDAQVGASQATKEGISSTYPLTRRIRYKELIAEFKDTLHDEAVVERGWQEFKNQQSELLEHYIRSLPADDGLTAEAREYKQIIIRNTEIARQNQK